VGVLKVERAVRPLLERLEEESEAGVMEQVIRSLGQIGDPGAVQAIEKYAVPGFFSRPARDIRIAGYRALASIGTPHARKVLEEARTDRDPEIRKVAEALLDEG
jgi:HEAT repeat protein